MCKSVSFPLAAVVIANNPIDLDPETTRRTWTKLTTWLETTLGCQDDIEGILFLVGLQEVQEAYTPDLDKQTKERLIMEGAYSVFETMGFYQRVGMDPDGYWIWEPKETLPPDLISDEQEILLKAAILRYFNPYFK